MKPYVLPFLLLTFLSTTLCSQTQTLTWSDDNFTGLELRSIGPALMSGRIADIAIHPEDDNTWYVAVASGGVWKSDDGGLHWRPVFDDQPVQSIGALAIMLVTDDAPPENEKTSLAARSLDFQPTRSGVPLVPARPPRC